MREMLIATWRAQNWPLQAMGFAEWEALAALGIEQPVKRTFPGNVTAERTAHQLVLSRRTAKK